MSGNPVSKPLHMEDHMEVDVTPLEWVSFKGDMLEIMTTGIYHLIPKERVFPEAPGGDQCSPEDKQLYGQMEAMEIYMLDTSIEAQLREVNANGSCNMLLDNISSAMSADVPNGKTLYVFDRFWRTDANKLKLLRQLGVMLEMRYEKILIGFKSQYHPHNS